MLLQDVSRADPSRRHLVRSGGVSFGNLNADHRRSHALHRFGEAVKQIQARQREGKVITAACNGSLSAKDFLRYREACDNPSTRAIRFDSHCASQLPKAFLHSPDAHADPLIDFG